MIDSEKNLNFVWNGIMKAIEAYNAGLPYINSDLVQATINNSDVEMAKKLIARFNLI